jgi:hypothetical protein
MQVLPVQPAREAAMPDFRCVDCRTRTRYAGDIAAEPCPGCGSPLELVVELAEVVGFRSVTTSDRSVDVAAPVGDFTARRNAMYAQRVRDALAAERWIDDGGFAVAAVALPTSDPQRSLGEDVTT